MTIYVLWLGEYDDRHVVAIYSAREGAVAAIKKGVGLRRFQRRREYEIEEYTLDAEVDDE